MDIDCATFDTEHFMKHLNKKTVTTFHYLYHECGTVTAHFQASASQISPVLLEKMEKSVKEYNLKHHIINRTYIHPTRIKPHTTCNASCLKQAGKNVSFTTAKKDHDQNAANAIYNNCMMVRCGVKNAVLEETMFHLDTLHSYHETDSDSDSDSG